MTAPQKPSRSKTLRKTHDKRLTADLQTFETLPTHTQELLLLSDASEKLTGTQRAKVDRKIKSAFRDVNPQTKEN